MLSTYTTPDLLGQALYTGLHGCPGIFSAAEEGRVAGHVSSGHGTPC